MIPLSSASYPFLAVSQHFGVDYGLCLEIGGQLVDNDGWCEGRLAAKVSGEVFHRLSSAARRERQRRFTVSRT